MTTVNATQNALASNAITTQPSTVLSSDFETFLNMLTVQMQNQDPLNPMDSSEYAMQLATFSGLEQQVQTNDLLSSLIYLGSQSGVADLAAWIGLEGRSNGPAHYDGQTGVEVLVAPVDYADSAQVVVYDEDGNEVDRFDIDPADSTTTWDGADQAEGLYYFQVESFVNGNLTEISAAETWARISEARSESGAVVLVLDGGGEVYADQVTGVRDPAS
ncbi:flagellar hook capping FlgD N-terminal domain-containing protein [Thalassovita sp.]|jgi:flagellar basal-body rod modification protein FlgD|uniref:flagellar hook capping FlgD N-terminal domain-containing protein n=1 Tax=Thalassovita sp. TaxID=1979401 RepID=UPI003B5ABAC5